MTLAAYPGSGFLLASRYRFREEIGRGGFSVVYAASDQTTGTEVAIKMLVPPPAMERAARERMKREVAVVTAIDNPGVVSIYEFIEEGPWAFVVMEKIDGPDLQSRVRQQGPLEPDHTVRIGREIGEILHHAHAKGILHRDIKPQNILLEHNHRARLTDFGSARMEGQATLTHTGGIVGTIDYLAPEIFAGARSDCRADIYSLGLTLYFSITGTLPPRPSPHVPPASKEHGFHPREIRLDVPEWLDALIAGSTATDPARRFPTALSFLRAIEDPGSPQAAHLSSQSARKICLICGRFEPFGIGICWDCHSADKGVWLFVDHHGGRAEVLAVHKELVNLMHRAESRMLLECAKGFRPLGRINKHDIDAARKALGQSAIQLRASDHIPVFSMIPPGFSALIATALICGLLTGLIANPAFLVIAPLLCLILYAAAYFNLRRPVLKTGNASSPFPFSLEKKLVGRLSEMPPGTARDLLRDLIWIAREMFGSPNRKHHLPDLFLNIEQLLEASASAATELIRLGGLLSRMELQSQNASNLPERWVEAYSQVERAHDLLVQRLLEAIATLSSLQTSLDVVSKSTNPGLDECIRQIDNEVQIQSRVATELNEIILQPKGNL